MGLGTVGAEGGGREVRLEAERRSGPFRGTSRRHRPSGPSNHALASSRRAASRIPRSRSPMSRSTTGTSTSTRRSRLRSMRSADPM